MCTGNTCRSPMAAALANDIFASRGINAVAVSCGVFAVPGAKASVDAIAVMKNDWDIDITNHKARITCDADLAEADIVIAMTAGHKNHLITHHPEFADKVHTVGEVCSDGRDIDDPFGGGFDTYMQCAKQIEKFLKNFNWEDVTL